MKLSLKSFCVILLSVLLISSISFSSTKGVEPTTIPTPTHKPKFPATSSVDYYDEEEHMLGMLGEMTVNEDGKLEYYSRIEAPELYCLAENIYHEARSDSFVGQIAVADVVLNRVVSSAYPNSICSVVKEGPITESWKMSEGNVWNFIGLYFAMFFLENPHSHLENLRRTRGKWVAAIREL